MERTQRQKKMHFGIHQTLRTDDGNIRSVRKTRVKKNKEDTWLESHAIRLQTTFRGPHLSDEIRCNFLQSALKEEPFSFWVTDFNRKTKS